MQFAPHITLTNSDFRFIVAEQLQALGIDPGSILIEPEVKSTAPAILAASIYVLKNDPEAVLMVAPSDHVIPDKDDFHRSIRQGLEQVANGQMVTFGITPTHPETGYGYLELPDLNEIIPEVEVVSRFVEKPDLKMQSVCLNWATIYGMRVFFSLGP